MIRRAKVVEKEKLEKLFKDHEFGDFKWINARDIVVAQWTRFRCQFGCPNYGKKAGCPPNMPSIDECRNMIREYSQCAVFHFEKRLEKPGDRKSWNKDMISKLVALEREVFLSGYYKTFLILFNACAFCDTCAENRLECKNPKMTRPAADAMGIDVYATVRGIGYHIEVLKDYTEAMHRYAFLLVE
jgi:predicted metal-binding protein